MTITYDLFYSHIIPDLLSEHLHYLILVDDGRAWNPFYTLPLVSRMFNHTCRKMSAKIFGNKKGKDGE